MKRKYYNAGHIPCVLFGDETKKLIIAVHGKMSHKEDKAIVVMAKEAIKKGYCVFSFDLPEHGGRIDGVPCDVENCKNELCEILKEAKTITSEISLFACSQGAYFSLQAYQNEQFENSMFLSPVVDMRNLIENLMTNLSITKEQLRVKKQIETSFGITLSWDYYSFVLNNPIKKWNNKTSILCGQNDKMVELQTVKDFANEFGCDLTILQNCEHYFHTKEQLSFLNAFVQKVIT